MRRRILTLIPGCVLFATGLYMIFGRHAYEIMENTGLQYRDVLFSPGLVLMGGGLFMLIVTLVRWFRR